MTTIKVTETNAMPKSSVAHHWVAEASEIGLKPGQWPKVIETDLGNGQPFVYQSGYDDEVTYKQQFGCVLLTVWND